MQEEQLFGAPPGDCRAASISISKGAGGRHLVTLYVHPVNRKDLLVLDVTATEEQGINTVLGAMVPFLMRASTSSVNFARRTMWAIHNRLGSMGYEVRIEHCGREPKH